MNVYRLSARIDEEMQKKLAARARLEATDESEVIRRALRQYLDEKTENAYVALMRTGGIGIAKGLPADLSTNKNHFEGFGSNDRARSSGHRSARRSSRGR